MSEQINIKKTLVNTALTLDQDKKNFSIRYNLDIDEDNAVLKVSVENANDKKVVEKELDWDENVIPMLSKCIKGKCSLLDLKEFNELVNTYIAKTFLKEFLNGFIAVLDEFYKEVCKIDDRSISAKLNSGFTEAIKIVGKFTSDMNEYLEDDEKISLGV